MKIIRNALLIIKSISVKIQREIYLIFLYRSFKKGIIDEYHFEIKRDWVSKEKQFGTWEYFYQTHPQLEIKGVRPTLSRLNNYGLFEYVDNKSTLLDIGCNSCFLSCYISNKVSKIFAVELDDSLYRLALKTVDYLGINNIELFNSDIKNYEIPEKVDLVMSFAIHRWVGIGLNEYIDLLTKFKKEDGLILIESHPDNDDRSSLEEAIIKSNLRIINKGITDDHLGSIRSFYYLK